MADALNFKNGNNACASLRIIAERLRAGDAQVILADVKADGVLELKIAWLGPTGGARIEGQER